MQSCGSNGDSEENYRTVKIAPSLAEAVKRYSSVRNFHNGLAIVERGGRYGFIDTLGNEVIPCEYIGLSWEEPGYYTTYITSGRGLSRKGLISNDGKRRTTDSYHEITYMPEFGLIMTHKPSYGSRQPVRFFDLDGNEVQPSFRNPKAMEKAQKHGELSSATPFYNGMSLVMYYNRPKQEDYYKIIDDKGDIIMSVTEKNGKVGVTDLNGKEIVPHKYVSIEDYDEGYLLVSDGENRSGLWDLVNGKETVAPIYSINARYGDHFHPIHTFIRRGYMPVWRGEGYSLVNPATGAIACESVQARGFDVLSNDHLLAFFEDGDNVLYDYAVYDLDGNEIIERSDYIQPSPQGYIVRKAFKDGDSSKTYYGAYSLKGKELVPVKYEYVGPVSEGLIPVQKEKDGKFGFVNLKGKYVIEPIYDFAGYFNEGLAPVTLNGHCGYVNRIGEDTFGEER